MCFGEKMAHNKDAAYIIVPNGKNDKSENAIIHPLFSLSLLTTQHLYKMDIYHLAKHFSACFSENFIASRDFSVSNFIPSRQFFLINVSQSSSLLDTKVRKKSSPDSANVSIA